CEILRISCGACNGNRKRQEPFCNADAGVLMTVEYILIKNVIIIDGVIIKLGTYQIHRSTEIQQRIRLRILAVCPWKTVRVGLTVIIQPLNSSDCRTNIGSEISGIT